MIGQLQKDSVAEKVVAILNRMETPIVLNGVKADSPLIQAELREMKRGRHHELAVKTLPPFPVGTTIARVTIETDSKEEPTIQLPVFFDVPARVLIVLQALTWPIPVQRDERRPIILRNIVPSPVHVKNVEVSDPAIRTETEVLAEGKQYKIWLAVPEGTAIPTAGWTVTVSTDDPKFRSLTAQVRGYGAATSRPAVVPAARL